MFARIRPVPSAAGWAPATSAPMAIRVEARGGHATVPRAGAPCWRPMARSAMGTRVAVERIVWVLAGLAEG
jgi:hypothetical protein